MNETPPRPRPSRSGILIGLALVVLLGGGLTAMASVAMAKARNPQPRWVAGQDAPAASATGPAPSSSASRTPSPAPSGQASQDGDPDNVVLMSATGDIIMGDAPGSLPARGGEGFFDGVLSAIDADLAMGNLEEPLTDDTGVEKCPAGSSGCHQFRAPPSYAKHLRDAGFKLLNQANNHGYDYGAAGYRNTQQALEKYGLKHTGAPNQITVVQAAEVKVAVVGFSSYVWSNSLIDIASAKQVVQRAAEQADIVVVQVHMGAEGSDKTHVRKGTEMFLGENRGDPIRFSRAVIDAGADLVVGHGPHVLRGMEFYKGRLIAYSLGNFSGGGGTLRPTGRLGLGGVLRVSLRSDGTWAAGQFMATAMNKAGLPTMDSQQRGTKLIRQLSKSDFPRTGANLDEQGRIIAPPAG